MIQKEIISPTGINFLSGFIAEMTQTPGHMDTSVKLSQYIAM